MMFFSPPRPNAKPNLWQDWREDVACVFARDPAARNLLEVLLAYPGVHAVLLYRVTHRLWLSDWKLSARLVAAFARWLTNVDIHPGATIGKRFFIDHGACVVIGETAEIGNDVTLYHGVTLGGTTWNKAKRHPTLGNNVLVGAGAKILGAITLGDNVRVGANSVVIKDVPACCTVIGIPGRIIQQKGVKIQNPRGIDLDHHLVPDPIGKALTCLVERLDKLEANQEKFVMLETENCDSCESESVCHGDEKIILKQAAGGK
ncbi:serine O-acetyltransferase [Methylomonas methanica]|uniref:serine O-acetyltransferase n=1 Tax=Methylomonas methanica (strain DSM 25384 / MC09) TaxID=857087 RepID=G0A3L2_METMM|nr:serine O-acetyltransferase [Methylomonas methanica MC09]